MIVSINIDSQDILDQYSISSKDVESVIDYTIKEVTAQFFARWQETASRELKTTRSRYIENLRLVDEGRMQGAVILDYSKDTLVKMLEEGASAFDIKQGFEKSAKRHIKKDGGWYITIPFKIGTPGVQVDSGFSSILPSQIYNTLIAQPVNPTTNRSAGVSKGGIPAEYAAPKVRSAFSSIPESKTFSEYKNKASVYEGVFKQKDAITGQNSYGSFRRVSDKSDENSWIHPGIEAHNLAEKTLDKFETIIETVVESATDNALKYFGFE